MRSVSKRRQRLLRQRSKMLAGVDRSVCEAAELVATIECAGPVDPHEPLSRGRGGSIVDRENVLMVCRRHHSWLHSHPVEAHGLGLLVHSWEKPA